MVNIPSQEIVHRSLDNRIHNHNAWMALATCLCYNYDINYNYDHLTLLGMIAYQTKIMT